MSVSTMEEAKEKTPTSSWQYNNENCYEGDKEHRLANQGLSDIEAINRLYDLEPCYKGKSRGVVNKCHIPANYKRLAYKDFETVRNDVDKIKTELGKLEVDAKT
ncbi:18424_t:CDS:2 [Gigaspora rosea]|nr:18424_t:CDS:2 [Gigaspora rosea]